MAEKKGFKSLRIEAWRQFSSIDLELHPRLTIITGANGAGKSTLLSFFTRHFGYSRDYLGIPKFSKGVATFSFGLSNWFRKRSWFTREAHPMPQIGEITYASGAVSAIRLPQQPSLHYSVHLDAQQAIPGIHIDSHRPPNVYRGLGTIPATAPALDNIGAAVNSEYMSYFAGGSISYGTLYHIKMTLIQMSIFGHGNKTMEPIPELITLFEEFEEKLRKIFPASLGFQRLIIRSPEILLSTRSGDFLIDAASGGVIKLFEVAWQLFFFAKSLKDSQEFVVTFDEPENHLHPSMQKSFLPNLMEAFPEAQIIVVTHSPFVISAMKESHVYVLRYEDTDLQSTERDDSLQGLMGTKVYAEKLDTVNKAGTASEILRDVLGISTTIPDWAGDRVQEIVSSFHGKMDAGSLKQLYARLEAEGLASSYPSAVANLTRRS